MEAIGLEIGNGFEDRCLNSLGFVGVASISNTEQTRIFWVPAIDVDVVNEFCFLTEFLVENCAISRAKNACEEVQSGGIGVRHRGDFETHDAAGDVVIAEKLLFSMNELMRFLRNERRRIVPIFVGLEGLLCQCKGFLCVDVASDDENGVIGEIAF